MKSILMTAAIFMSASSAFADTQPVVLAEGFVSTTLTMPNEKNADSHLFLSEDGTFCVRSKTLLAKDGAPEASRACDYLKAAREAGQELARFGFSYAAANESFGLHMRRAQNEYTLKNRATAGIHMGGGAVVCIKEVQRSLILPQAYVSFTAKLVAVPSNECAATFKTPEERSIVTAAFNKYGF